MCLPDLSPQALQLVLFVVGLITGIIACRIVTSPLEADKQTINYNGHNGAGYQPIDNGKELKHPPKSR